VLLHKSDLRVIINISYVAVGCILSYPYTYKFAASPGFVNLILDCSHLLFYNFHCLSFFNGVLSQSRVFSKLPRAGICFILFTPNNKHFLTLETMKKVHFSKQDNCNGLCLFFLPRTAFLRKKIRNKKLCEEKNVFHLNCVLLLIIFN
jgi:hypothetical protein